MISHDEECYSARSKRLAGHQVLAERGVLAVAVVGAG